MQRARNSLFCLAIVATVGCRTGDSGSSGVKDFNNPDPNAPQSVQASVPQGGSTTGLLGFSVPIQASGLSVHTNCNLQLVSVIVQSEVGIGPLARGSDDSTWVTSSGLVRNFTAVQLSTNNFGPPAFCTYTISGFTTAQAQGL